jgi:hypothetical protein
MELAEKRRSLAKFNTGSINKATALALRALTRWHKPNTIVEVGTFIGVSTLSMRANVIYTCDASNDCLAGGRYGYAEVVTHPYTKSHEMLPQLVKAGHKPRMFFFDGLLSLLDMPHIHKLSGPDTIFVLDDHNHYPDGRGYKGVENAKLLQKWFHNLLLIQPAPDTTLAVMVRT